MEEDMLKLERNNEYFRVMFKGECVLEHSRVSPAVFVGQGNETIESYRGNYQIEDRLESRIPLRDIEVNENACVFSSHGISVIVDFRMVDQRLTMKFSCDQPEVNRFWIRIKADKNEKVYGCGEQASYFNLRNRNYPLWTSEPGVGRDKSTLTTFYADKVDKAGGDYYTTYYPEPTFVSTRKYWLHVESTAYAEFDFRSPDFHELMFWEVPGELTLNFSDSYLELLTDLTEFTGRPPQLPDFLHDGIILGVQGGMETVT
jgi:sulfoquinovosidase